MFFANTFSLPGETPLPCSALGLSFWRSSVFLSPKELAIPTRADHFGTVSGEGWHGDDSAHPRERRLRHSGPLPPLLPGEPRTADASVLAERSVLGSQGPPLLELSSAPWTPIPELLWSWFSSVRNSKTCPPTAVLDNEHLSAFWSGAPPPTGQPCEWQWLWNTLPVWRAPHGHQDLWV